MVYGFNGKSKDIKLKRKIDSRPCERYKYDIADIGALFKLRVSFLSKKVSTSWFLDRV
jgi:hypothetical protein